MIIVVSNLWPRAQFYERLPQIAQRLCQYSGDPEVDRLASMLPLDELVADCNAPRVGRSSAPDRPQEQDLLLRHKHNDLEGPEIARQYIFFTLLLRALLQRYGSDVQAVVGYCSGIIPVLNAASVYGLSKQPFLSPHLMAQLAGQDSAVAANVLDHDVAMSILTAVDAEWQEADLVRDIRAVADQDVYLTDVKSRQTVVLSGRRTALMRVIDWLKSQRSHQIRATRLVPHGGLHTPLAAPSDWARLDGHPSWESLRSAIETTPYSILSSAGSLVGIKRDAAALEGWARSTLFSTVRSCSIADLIRSSGDRVLYVGLPAVIADMFVGTGVRPSLKDIVGPEHL